jgi:hypothetical protein
MKTQNEYKCKQYSDTRMSCQPTKGFDRIYKKCPIGHPRIHNIVCQQGIVIVDWIKQLIIKDIIDESFIKL